MAHLRIRSSGPLHGHVAVDGDKSISHRAVLLGSLADGATHVHNFLPATDCWTSVAVTEALGARVERHSPSELTIHGVGQRGWWEPDGVLDCGTSGTTCRLLIGLLAGHPFTSFVSGANQLRRRPMRRVVEPLRTMGATILGRADDSLLPLGIRGGRLRSLEYTPPVASAQVKSAVLLAGLFAEGAVTVHEPVPTRDHTERMLDAMGARLEQANGAVRVQPLASPLAPLDLTVPGDISSAAFPLAAAAIVKGSEIELRGVGVNTTRTGLLDVLHLMGLRLELVNSDSAGEPIADIGALNSPLRAIEIGGSMIPRLIDELPVLAVVATQAEGTTLVRDAAELRVKETDRIAVTAGELRKLGALVTEQPDGFSVRGPAPLRGTTVDSHGDHRLAMALAVAGLVAQGETTVLDADCIGDSFPSFVPVMQTLGADIEVVE